MAEETADGTDRGGDHEAAGGGEAKPGTIEDANSQRVQEPVRAAGVDARDDDQIESSLVPELGAPNPEMARSEPEMEEGSSHLFTDAMKLQLRAQILVLGDLLKGVAPNPDWLEDAFLESAIGAESVLLESVDVPRGSQDVQCGNTCIDDIPTVSNLQRISSAFRDAEARMSPFSGAADFPSIRDVIKDEIHSAGTLSTPREPSSGGKGVDFRDDSVAQETEIAPAGQMLIAYDHARSNSNVPEDSRDTENRTLDSDKHLDLAQASAQDALTTATSALAQSHLVWARLHSQDHSEEGIARDARLASVAATVAAASSVAKAAVEAARAIAEVSMDAFIQASGYQLGDPRTLQFGSSKSRPLQVEGGEQTQFNNGREIATPSQQRADMLESVVQAAGKAAEAASQAGAVLAKANPMVQSGGLSEFWARKPDDTVVEHEEDEAIEMNEVAAEMDGLDREDHASALNELGVAHEQDVLDEMENVQENDTAHHDELVLANDVLERVPANKDEGVEEGGATAIEDHVAAANGDEAVGVFRVNDVADPFDQEKRLTPKSRKMKRGRGRSRGVYSRAKRTKVSVGVSSSPLGVHSPENAMHEEVDVSETLEGVRHESARVRKRGAKHVEYAPSSTSGQDPPVTAPAEGLDDVTHETVEALESRENARDRNSRAQKRGAKSVENRPVGTTGEGAPATAPVRSPEDETPRQRNASASRKIDRRKKRGAKLVENGPMSAAAEDIPATATPAESPDKEVKKQDDIVESPENAPGKELGAQRVENKPVSANGEDVPAGEPAESPANGVLKQDDALKIHKTGRGKKRGPKRVESKPVSASREDVVATAPVESPANEMHRKAEVPNRRKNVQVGHARGRTRSAKHIENKTVSSLGKGSDDQEGRGPESGANAVDSPDNALREGASVEVMIDEVGLRGGWFSGTVLKVTKHEAFVELLDLLTDDGKANVKEWFPLVEGFNQFHPRRHARPVHPFTIFSEAGSRKRRRVALGSQTWHRGDQVDAFIQDAWWEGLVAEINDLDPTKATVYFPEENDTQVVKTFNLRPSFQWKDSKWIPWKSPILLEGERPQKRHRTGVSSKTVTPDEGNAQAKSSEERAEGSRLREAIPAAPKPPVHDQPESEAPLPRSSTWKKLNRRNESTTKAPPTNVLSPRASRRINDTVRTALIQTRTPLTRGRPRHRRKRQT